LQRRAGTGFRARVATANSSPPSLLSRHVVAAIVSSSTSLFTTTGDDVAFSNVDLESHERGFPALLDLVEGMPVGSLVFAEQAVAGDIWLPGGKRLIVNRMVIVGPLGLVEILETQLGMLAPTVSTALRTAT